MNVGRGVGSEIDGGSFEVFRVAPAAGGNAGEDGLAALGVVAEGFGVIGVDVAGGYGINVDASACPLVGECLGELADTSFAGSVTGDIDAPLESEQ